MACTFDQHRVVVRGDNGTSKAVASVETDTVATSRSIYFDLSSVRRKPFRRIFRGNSTLNSKPAGRYLILCQAELFQCSTCSDLYLRSYKINACDFFRNRMLYLTNTLSVKTTKPGEQVTYILGLISIK